MHYHTIYIHHPAPSLFLLLLSYLFPERGLFVPLHAHHSDVVLSFAIFVVFRSFFDIEHTHKHTKSKGLPEYFVCSLPLSFYCQ